MNLCPNCEHEAHELGKCPKDNCGESYISKSGATKRDRTKFVTYINFAKGEVSTDTVTHIKPRKTDQD